MNLHPLSASSSAGPSGPDREKIREAARGFEGLFLAQLLKIMKNSVPGAKDETLLRSDVLTEFADLEFARVLAERRGIGLSDMLYRSLAKGDGEPTPEGKVTPLRPLIPAATVPVALKKVALPLTAAPVSPKKAAMPLTGAPVSPKKAAMPLPATRAWPAPTALKPAPSPTLEPIIERAAKRHGLHPELLRAVIACESSGNPRAESSKGAKGLMQLADSTAQMLGVRDVWDPEENVEGGARYLKNLLDRFENRLDWALAAYNAGPTAVVRHQGVPPFDETERYVQKVLDRFHGPGMDTRHGS